MNFLKKEPALILGFTAALAQMSVMYFETNPASRYAWALPVLTVLAAYLTRRKVASESTVNQAGYTMDELVQRADNPAVRPAVE